MPKIPLRQLPARPAHAIADAWLARLEEKLADPAVDRSDLCRDTLVELSFPRFAGRVEEALQDETIAL
ncbi:MAG: hypothetical protein ACYC0B_11020, partial [Gemmatimonadaceae bacterium]